MTRSSPAQRPNSRPFDYILSPWFWNVWAHRSRLRQRLDDATVRTALEFRRDECRTSCSLFSFRSLRFAAKSLAASRRQRDFLYRKTESDAGKHGRTASVRAGCTGRRGVDGLRRNPGEGSLPGRHRGAQIRLRASRRPRTCAAPPVASRSPSKGIGIYPSPSVPFKTPSREPHS